MADVQSAANSTNLDAALLAVTQGIGQDVLDKTGGDHYRSGQPLRGHPDYVEPGTTPETTPPELEQTKTEAPTVEDQKLYAGKYKSIEEWEKATYEAGNTISRLAKENEEISGRLRTIEQTMVPPKPVEVNPLDEVEQFGIPKEPLEKAIEAKFNQMMENATRPYNERVKADQAILEKYPEYKDNFNDLIGWLKTNPDVEKQVALAEGQGSYELAREFAWLKFTQNRGTQEESKLIEQSNAQAKERKNKLIDATVTDHRSGHTRDQSTAPKDNRQVTSDELEQLKVMSKGGYEAQAWAKVLNPLLPKDEYWQ